MGQKKDRMSSNEVTIALFTNLRHFVDCGHDYTGRSLMKSCGRSRERGETCSGALRGATVSIAHQCRPIGLHHLRRSRRVFRARTQVPAGPERLHEFNMTVTA